MKRGLSIIIVVIAATPAHAAGLFGSSVIDNLSVFALGVGGLILGWRSSRAVPARRDDDA